MRSLFRSLPVLLVPGLALAACDSPSGPGRAGPPARLDIVSGDLQTTGTVGSELPQPLVVRVLDEKGKPVPNQIVNFRVTAGGGSVFAGTAQTNGDGEARERWSLGTVAHDTQRVEARAVDSSTGAPLVFATFRAVGRPDAPAAIAVAGAAARTGVAGRPIADSLAVKVSDRYGNAVPGVAVAWTALSGGGSLSPPTSTTGSDGVARAQWTLGSDLAAPQAAEAAVGALRAGFTATAAAPFSGLLGAGGNQQTGATGTALADSVAVRAVDHTGAAVAGVTVEWQVLSGGGSVSPATSVTGADGIARTRWTLGPTAGEQRMHGRARIGPQAFVGFISTASAFVAAPPRVASGEIKVQGSGLLVTGTVWPDGVAGSGWFEGGTQPDLSDGQPIAAAAYGAGFDAVQRSASVPMPSSGTVYYRMVAQNAYGTRRGEILSFRAPATAPNFRTRFDPATLEVVVEWDDIGEWYAFVERRYTESDTTWFDIFKREAGAPRIDIPGTERQARDVTFDVKAGYAGPYRVIRCSGSPSQCQIHPVPGVAITPMSPPTNLQATRAGTSVHLTWQDNSPNEVEFVVLRDGQQRAVLSANATQFTDTATTPGATHVYQVVAMAKYRNLLHDSRSPVAEALRRSHPTNSVSVTIP